MTRLTWFSLVIVVALAASSLGADETTEALRNATLAQEALVRSHRVLNAYLKRMDPETKLLPHRGGSNTWNVHDSAADLYPFLVLAAYLTDRKVFEEEMHEILRHEILHTTRIGMLSDNVILGGKGFKSPELNLDRVIFGSCEYAKDGLLPITEFLGSCAWYERLVGIADGIIEHAPYRTKFGRVPSLSAEVNGEFLQVLTRLAYRTRKPSYIEQAVHIADFYFKEVIPKSGGLPAHVWDLEAGKPRKAIFRAADHGNEIVGGLSELVLYLKETAHPRYTDFEKPLSAMVHRLLDCGVNEDGVWYSAIGLPDGTVTDSRHAHCWGYLFNGVYTTFLITGEQRFMAATRKALRAVTSKPTTYLDDPAGSGRGYGSNAYSDAIESAIVFLNRFPDERMAQVLDTCVVRFLRRQRADGIIEDWYGDGNYVRTALMFALMKSSGTSLQPWRGDLQLGAVATSTGLIITLKSTRPWQGRLHFDSARHRTFFNMTTNYPRLNEFPEWFVVAPDRLYRIKIGNSTHVRLGAELRRGLQVSSPGEDVVKIELSPLPGPPYSGR